MEEKEYYTLDEVKDEFIGKVGSPARDEYESDIDAYISNAKNGKISKIETEEQYEVLLKRVEHLMLTLTDETPADNPEMVELGVLGNLVCDYEDRYYPLLDMEYKGYFGTILYNSETDMFY